MQSGRMVRGLQCDRRAPSPRRRGNPAWFGAFLTDETRRQHWSLWVYDVETAGLGDEFETPASDVA